MPPEGPIGPFPGRRLHVAKQHWGVRQVSARPGNAGDDIESEHESSPEIGYRGDGLDPV